ncbi:MULTISPECIES: hypothetical protein [Vibrio]|uniref:hypothetical protein n=1 Tax=Vibrio TaxID=662 RepID=UPI0002D3BA52|nr:MULTISPECIES: hypothetical protein [Vibrio]OED86843.1 hypothetical protein OAQ_20970 [Vibrio cyclitrophicus ZF30]CAK3065684.1 conserved hypothetical protein [Vibrio crassostreae]CAK3069955.1 conserved hypothetical protein [Vibrio crassostreae]CDT26504.1 ATPase involved in DNA repair (modular protein) [Vibrio crassostreae]CDT37046.1 ATPase involved in DNA repair (modular protein) [Vibrio crassostreae]
MSKEVDSFRVWANFKNKKMVQWLAQYFVKKGIPKKLPSVEDINTYSQEDGILEQAEHYFFRIEDQALRQEKLSMMKKSWAQYSRRTKGDNSVHTVYVDDSTHKVLKTIKKQERLNNLGQSVESIIDGTAFKREIRRLENANDLLHNQLKDFPILQESNRKQEIQLREMRDKTESLEQRNLMLTKALEQLVSSLKSE